MGQTIDKKVSEILKKEKQKLSAEQRNNYKIVADIDRITGNQSDNYTIVPKDTIGKCSFQYQKKVRR